MDGLPLIVFVFAAPILYYGFPSMRAAIAFARVGIVHVRALVVGAMSLWAGGLLSLAAGTLTRNPPRLPVRDEMLVWSGCMVVLVAVVLMSRRPDVEARLSDEQRTAFGGGRYIVLGIVIAAVVCAVTGYYV